jgi:putative transposase
MWRVNATGSREPATGEVRLHRCREGRSLSRLNPWRGTAHPDQPHVPRLGGQPERLLRLAGTACPSSPAAGHGLSGAYPHGLRAVEGHLWQSAHAPRPQGRRARDRAAPRGASDARYPVDRAAKTAPQAHDGQRTCLARRAQAGGAGLHGGGPGQGVGADISYIWTAEGRLYLAVVLDLFSPRAVGWATRDHLKRDLAVEALRRALAARNPASGRVHHSDHGSQYCSVDYQALLRKRGILISISGRGNCSDNSMVLRRENSPLGFFLILLTFFSTIKSEIIWPVAWQSRQQAENVVARYIEGFNNPVKRHSSLGFQSPIAFERKFRNVS